MKATEILSSWNQLDKEIIDCRLCPRLVAWRESVANLKKKAYREQKYWGKPVPGFGDHQARVLVVGLAPGAHGSNRTGRMFTGDSSGHFLYKSLYRNGFANQPGSSHLDDGLTLSDLYISAVCRCAPPENMPQPDEIKKCRPFLEAEMKLLSDFRVVVALGKVAFDQVLQIILKDPKKKSGYTFKHGAVYQLASGPPFLISSYHPSRQNTQTGRLTEEMFSSIWQTAKHLLSLPREEANNESS